MSYPQQVPPGWTKGESVYTIGGSGPRYAVMRGPENVFSVPPADPSIDDIAIMFDSRADCVAWLKWWQE